MKFLMLVLCIMTLSICSADSHYHEFEGISEIYNIRSLKVLSQFLPENPVIIESGAYQGRDTLKLAQKIPTAHIYAFEPLATAFFKLSEVMTSFSNVSLFNIALDDTTGIKDFYICHGTYGQSPLFEFHSSLLKPTGSSAVHLMGPTEQISCISLYDFCKSKTIDQIDMLCLSTEGNELQILKGAHEFLGKISLIFIHTQLFPSREFITLFADLKNFMETNDFILLSHFYLKDIHGDALFVKKEIFNKSNH